MTNNNTVGEFLGNKRVYQSVSFEKISDGFIILLDGKRIMTPAKRPFIVPEERLAQRIVDEFTAQDQKIHPEKMPIFRLVNTVLDVIIDDPQPLIEDILRYVSHDVTLYRADSPQELVLYQNNGWDPILDWAMVEMSADFSTTTHCISIEQKPETLLAVNVYLRRFTSPFLLAALHHMVCLTASPLIVLAIAAGHISVDSGWDRAHIELNWELKQWGNDEEALSQYQSKKQEFDAAAMLLTCFKS